MATKIIIKKKTTAYGVPQKCWYQPKSIKYMYAEMSFRWKKRFVTNTEIGKYQQLTNVELWQHKYGHAAVSCT